MKPPPPEGPYGVIAEFDGSTTLLSAIEAAKAGAAGTDAAEITVDRDIKSATVEGQRTFIEAILVATAAGRPRIAA